MSVLSCSDTSAVALPISRSTPVAPVPSAGRRRLLKAVSEQVSAGLLLVALLPLFLLIAAVIKATSPGTVFFRQVRVGIDGREFRMWKFRTMVSDAEVRAADLAHHNDADGLLFKIRHDPRVTQFGRWLRRTSLDELPQLFNVVGGSMALVGPRPPLPAEVARYDDVVRRRLLVRPGLTGLWQVSGRSDLSWEDSIRLDLHYVDNWSHALDFAILWRTVAAVTTGRGAY